MDIRRCVGDQNVIIPCLYSQAVDIITWRINGEEYFPRNIPATFQFVVIHNFGLRISEITNSMDQTMFQCVYSRSEEGRHHESPLGVLTVVECKQS